MLVPWAEFKGFCAQIGGASKFGYFETDDSITVWVSYRGITLESEIAKTNAEDLAYFEANIRSKGNVPEAETVRITTCRFGRKLSSRFVSFKTSDPASMDNTDENGADFGDFIYSMRTAANVVTTTPALAARTILDFYPTWDYEISGGIIFLPPTLDVAMGDLDEWELHVKGAPDIPSAYGGNVVFLANNRLKWIVNQRLELDASLNPAEVSGSVIAVARKIRFTFLHPIGAHSEFQINVKVYR